MEQKTYSLKELCLASDVTERTVRFYIAEGLLPPPQGSGPLSRYGYEHWLRLQFVRRLKDEFLPLGEIKLLLDGKSLADLDELAHKTGLLAGTDAVEVAQDDNKSSDRLETLLRPGNVDLLRQRLALNETAADYSVAEKPLSSYPLPPPKPSLKPPRILAPTASMPNPLAEVARPVTATPERFSEWQHIEIRPGLELHIEKSLADTQGTEIRALLAMARQLFRG